MSTYEILLYTHSWLRWAVLILALWVIFRSFSGWFGRKKYLAGDNKAAVFFVASMHLQLVIGLLLYFVFSPIVQTAFQDFGAAMKNSAVRYWAVEHIFVMVLAVVLVQVGRIISKKSKTDRQKHKQMAVYSLIALVLMLSRIPWNEAGRMFRGL